MHVAQPIADRVVVKGTGPGADRLAIPVQHADDGEGQVAQLFGAFIRLGSPYLARAGQQTAFAGSDDASEVAWYADNAMGTTHPVAAREPNAYGLYDMSAIRVSLNYIFTNNP